MTARVDPALLSRMRSRIAEAGEPVDLATLLRREETLLADQAAATALTDSLSQELTGAGPLEELLAEPEVTDVLVNGADDVWVDRGAGLQRALVQFESDAAVRRLAVRLAGQVGRRLDDSCPFVDASLVDGTRLHAVLPPIVTRPSLSLRVLRRRRLSLSRLVELGTMTGGVAALLRAAVAARVTVLISGGAGTGKTTLLAAMLGAVDATERIVTVEDSAELVIEHPHVVGLFARGANAEGAGAVTLAELVRQALRMRADRLVVGEFRGAETVELLTALNTGHSGGAATVHANSVADVPARLIALAALAGMPAAVLQAQAASSLELLVHLRRGTDRHRRVDEVALWPGPGADNVVRVWSAGAGVNDEAAGRLATRLAAHGIDVPLLLAPVPS